MKKIVLLFLCLFSVYSGLTAQTGIDKQTFIYAIKGTDTLRLDKYDSLTKQQPSPCVVFMFGGGFHSGQRDSRYFLDYFNHLVENGYTVISIDYRLGLKDAQISTSANPMQFITFLGNSIQMAVEDLYDATSFIVDCNEEWKIDANAIIACGSSAGAISVLHGEYNICNSTNLTKKLPDKFRYAGIIAFAGAIFSTEGDIKWRQQPAPIQFFHGDADSNVPYDKIELYNFGFYGSKHIAQQLNEMNSPYYFYSQHNAAHEVSGSPIKENLDEIDSFLNKFVKKKLHLVINQQVAEIGKPEMKKDFNLIDYIKSNWSK